MTLKLAQLPLHLQPSDAHTIIDFLNLLSDLLWNHYGLLIQQQHRHLSTNETHSHFEPDQGDLLSDLDNPC
jgi:hypothetical protein